MAHDGDRYKEFDSAVVHGGQAPNPIHGAVVPGIEMATTYAQKSPGEHLGFEYSRTGNPTRQVLEKLVAESEGGKFGLAFASGSAATASIVSILETGDHIISIDDVYGGTNRYFRHIAERVNGMKVSMVDLRDAGNLERALTPRTKMLWLESPTNPMLTVTDIARVAAVAKRHGVLVVVDNTFATPYNQQPLALGADIVVHSATKYLNGHSDVVLGVLACNDEALRDRLAFVQNSVGAVPSPFDCYLVIRGMKTLSVRMERHAENAARVAAFLAEHPKVERVFYPHLATHGTYEAAKRQMRTGGGIVTFWLKGGLAESRQFLEALKLFHLAESLGCVECLAEHPAIMTHASVPPEERAKLGISDNLIRLSVGIEHHTDIIADLERALAAVGAPRGAKARL